MRPHQCADTDHRSATACAGRCSLGSVSLRLTRLHSAHGRPVQAAAARCVQCIWAWLSLTEVQCMHSMVTTAGVTGIERVRQYYFICRSAHCACQVGELADCPAAVNDPAVPSVKVRDSQDFLRICVRVCRPLWDACLGDIKIG